MSVIWGERTKVTLRRSPARWLEEELGVLVVKEPSANSHVSDFGSKELVADWPAEDLRRTLLLLLLPLILFISSMKSLKRSTRLRCRNDTVKCPYELLVEVSVRSRKGLGEPC